MANGTAERDAALVMLQRIPGGKQVTVRRRGFDTRDFVAEVTPHVAQNACAAYNLVRMRNLATVPAT